jgi:hypothetical protein
MKRYGEPHAADGRIPAGPDLIVFARSGSSWEPRRRFLRGGPDHPVLAADYTATGSVLVKSRQLSKSPQTIESTQIRVWEVDLATMTTEMKILATKELIEETLTELNDQGKLRGGERLDRDSLLSMVDTVMGNITAAVVPASNIIEITLKGKNARDTKVILNELLNKYISFRSGIYNPEKASVFFKGEADTFESGLRSMDKEKLELADAAKSADPALEIQNNLDLRKTLEQQLDTAKQELNNLNLTIGHLEKQLAERDLQFFSSIENPAINLLGAKLQDIYLEKTNLLRTFTRRATG